MYTIAKGSAIEKKTIEDAIKANENELSRFNDLDNYYDGKHAILGRKKSETLSNRKIVINHAEYISDLYTGYLIGTPVDYQLIDDTIEDAKLEPILEQFRTQTISDLDTEIATDCSIFGKAYEYVYANENNEVRSAKIDPRNCIVVYDDTMDHKPMFAIIYGKADTKASNYTDVMVVDAIEVRKYDAKLNAYTAQAHSFGAVPVVEYRNNAKEKGDFEQVIPIIDAINVLESDRLNDKEQLVESILVTQGFKMSEALTTKLKEYRIMAIPAEKEGGKAFYLTKQLNEDQVEVFKKSLENELHKISKTPNMSDQEFVGNASGVAIKYKILPFEWNTKRKERYLETGLKLRFSLYNAYLNKLNGSVIIIPIHKVDVVFHRGLPNNDFETSQMINNLDGKVDDETLISQLSFVKDASRTVEAVMAQKKENMKLLVPQMGTNEPNNPDNTPASDSNV